MNPLLAILLEKRKIKKKQQSSRPMGAYPVGVSLPILLTGRGSLLPMQMFNFPLQGISLLKQDSDITPGHILVPCQIRGTDNAVRIIPLAYATGHGTPILAGGSAPKHSMRNIREDYGVTNTVKKKGMLSGLPFQRDIPFSCFLG